MKRYSDWSPTAHDTKGLNLDDMQDWMVLSVSVNRDSGTLARSNFSSASKELSDLDPDQRDWETHSFNHWACGWFNIILVRPESGCHLLAADIERRLEDYPILNEDDYNQLLGDDCDDVWRCMRPVERIAFYKKHPVEGFEFIELLRSVRGAYFLGYASELVEDNGT